MNKGVFREGGASKLHYSPSICWFRDYWSNRKELKRNVRSENSRIDTGSREMKELAVMERHAGRCDVLGMNGELLFTKLVDPYRLVRQLEPQAIVVHDETDMKLEEVRTEPLGPSSFMTDLKRLSRTNPLAYFAALAFTILLGFVLTPSIVLQILVFVSAPLYVVILTTKYVTKGSAAIYLYQGHLPETFHYIKASDIPTWLEPKPYWVFRYLFEWKREWTIERSGHWQFRLRGPKDLERIELWLDASTGRLEWIVTDYHWRELWYDVEPGIQNIRLWVISNFHTLIPLTIETEGRVNLYQDFQRIKKKYTSLHPADWIAAQVGMSSISPIVKTLSNLHWRYWRYPLGLDSNLYQKLDIPAISSQPPQV